MAAISKQEYLKRYLSNADNEKKKKKRKKPKTTSKFMRSVIVDDDVGLDALKPSKETIQNYEEELQAFDEAPTVFDEDGVTAISAESFRKREEEKKTKWAPVVQKGELGPSFKSDKDRGDVDVLLSRKGRHDSPDLSPLRDNEKTQTLSASPKRRVRHDSSDSSPPRKTNANEKFERHEKRKKRSSINSPPGLDQSPLRNRRHDSPDNSPPRRKQQRSESMDLSPQRMKPQPSPNLSPVRKTYLDSPDNSPPRRRKQMIDSPEMSSRRAKHLNTSCDLSPPRKLRHDSSDISPPRRRRQSVSPDLSPPRHKLSGELSPYRRKTNFHNLSPHHQRLRHDSDESPPRQRNLSPRSPVHRGIKREREKESEIKIHQAGNRKKAGLHSASQLKTENEHARKREEVMFANMDASLSGRDAKTVHRDKHGRKRDLKFEKLKQREKERKRMEDDAKFMEWGKGVTQTKEAKQKQEDEVYEMSKPLARYKDDRDLDDMLKNQDRAGDPMLAFLQKKQIRKDEKAGKKAKPRYKGQAPPNRFNIWPGYRWDGVDRSNGFEKRRFEMLSNKRATKEEAYKWSTEDM